jgi:hypothetical protein
MAAKLYSTRSWWTVKVFSSITSIDRMRRKASPATVPESGFRPTSQVNTMSAAVTGVPSPQVASGCSR